MNFSETITFALMLFVSVDVALGEETVEKWGDIDYDWDRIREYAAKYTTEENEFATSKDGWLEIYRRQLDKKQTRGKSCQVIPPSKEEIIEITLRNPQAKLFTSPGKTGNFEGYDFNSSTYKGGCHNLKKYGGQIKSVDTNGSCVRLFSVQGCQSWSQAMYPGNTNIPDARLNGVRAIGPCVSNEFERSALIKSTNSSAPPQLEKLTTALESFANVPDVIGDYYNPSDWTSVRSSFIPISSYLLGPGNRVEGIFGSIYSRHLRSAASAENARAAGLRQSFYSKLQLEKSDEPGFAFPLELGGPAHEFYNVFPQNRKQAGYFKGKIVPLVKQMFKDYPDQRVFWNVVFVYGNSTTTRPSGMWYKVVRSSEEILYGYFTNSE